MSEAINPSTTDGDWENIKMKKVHAIVASFLAVIVAIFAYSLIVPPPLPQALATDILRDYLRLEHPANLPAPASLQETGAYGEYLSDCAETTDSPTGKLLLIYNPKYDTQKKDWILVVMGREWFGLRKSDPLVLWNDLTQSREPSGVSLVSGEDGLCYYYFAR